MELEIAFAPSADGKHVLQRVRLGGVVQQITSIPAEMVPQVQAALTTAQRSLAGKVIIPGVPPDFTSAFAESEGDEKPSNGEADGDESPGDVAPTAAGGGSGV